MPKKKNILELTRCSAAEYQAMPKLPLRVLLDNVRSLHNVGSVFRTSDAFLVDKVILAGITGRPPHPEITKSALGAENTVEWTHIDDSLEEVRRLKGEGWKVCVLEQTHDSILLPNFKVPGTDRLLLVAGNEVNGVDQRIVDLADYVLEIPQWGTKHSLNVSVSAGIAIYTLAMGLHC